MVNNKKFKITTILLTFIIFFGHLIPIFNYYHMLGAILLIIILFALANKGKITVNNNILWILCLIVLIISLVFSANKLETLKFLIMFFSILLIKMVYEGQDNWQNFLGKSFFCASSIHVLLTLMQFLFPKVITKINSLILTNDDLYFNADLLNRGAYAGITGQTGINAFYISIFIAIVFCKLITSSKRKVILLILLIIGIIALLLTVKRSQVIVNGMAMLSVLLIFSKSNNNKITYVTIPILVVGAVYLILANIPAASAVFTKFALFADSSDFTNGRIYLWESTLRFFSEHPIIGVGVGAIDSYLKEMSHNIYIQLLGELGILGFTTFTLAFLISLLNAVRIINNSIKDKDLDQKEKCMLAYSLYLQIYFLLYGLSGNPLYSPIFLVPYIQMIAVVNSYKKVRKKHHVISS